MMTTFLVVAQNHRNHTKNKTTYLSFQDAVVKDWGESHFNYWSQKQTRGSVTKFDLSA